MLNCYVDESTSFGEADPSTCIAGYVATGKQWAVFGRAWNRMLKHYGVEVFHTKDFETEEGRKRSIYKRWSKKKRKEFQNGIIDIIVRAGLKDVGIAMPLSAYKAALTPDRIKTFGTTPDKLCALFCMMSAGGYALSQKGVYKQAPNFIVECGGTYSSMLKTVHQYLLNESIYRDFYQLSSLSFVRKSKEYPELQAADYLAFNMGKRSSHVVDPSPPADAKLESLADGRKVRQTRYPLVMLYSESESNVFHFATPEIAEKAFQMVEAPDPPEVIRLKEARLGVIGTRRCREG